VLLAFAPVFLAALLRFSALDYSPLKLDEVEALRKARAMLETGVLAADGGRTSWGLVDPALVIYLLTIPLSLSSDPRLAAAFIGLLDIASVACVTWLGIRLFGRVSGISAGLLYAASPWSVYYARDTWVNLIPLFTSVMLVAAFQVSSGKKRWALVFFGSLALQLQTHMLAVALLPPALLLIVLTARHWLNRWGVLGGALIPLALVPYLSQWSALAGAQAVPGMTARPIEAAEVLWRVWFLFKGASGRNIGSLLGWEDPEFVPFAFALNLVHVVVLAATALAGVAMLWGVIGRREQWQMRLGVGLCLVAPTALFALSGREVWLHYSLAFYPAVFLVVAYGLGFLFRLIGRPRLALAAVGLIVVVQVSSLAALSSLFPSADLGGGFGIPAGWWSRVARETQATARAEGAGHLYVATRGYQPAYDDLPAALAYTMGPALRPDFVSGDMGWVSSLVPVLWLDLAEDPNVQRTSSEGSLVKEVQLPGRTRTARLYVIPPTPGPALQ
jgi:4-amino-4-deoxy-L-arabinose transferase-like glycosyltransferase